MPYASDISNEGKACDAVVRLLEHRAGHPRSDIRRPEKEHTVPPVDLLVRVGEHRYALEHTETEAFPGQIRMAKQFGDLISPISAELSGKLPVPGIYYLYLPIDPNLKRHPGALAGAQRDLADWIQNKANELYGRMPTSATRAKAPFGYSDRIRGVPPGFPFEVTLERKLHWSQSPRHQGVLLPARYAPGDVDPLRRNRLETALKKKCPKLQRCKQQGTISVLVLEDNDIALSNHIAIGETIAELLPARSDVPDEIYIVETMVEPWTVWTLKRGTLIWPDEDHVDVDSSMLTDLTA